MLAIVMRYLLYDKLSAIYFTHTTFDSYNNPEHSVQFSRSGALNSLSEAPLRKATLGYHDS